MIAFVDTSALIRRYLPEQGSAQLLRLLRSRRVIAVATITFAELCAGVSRAHRSGRISIESRDAVLERIPADFQRFDLVEARWRVLMPTRELVQRHALRGYDAIQLAACLEVHRSAATELWAADGELIAAARAEGLKVVAL